MLPHATSMTNFVNNDVSPGNVVLASHHNTQGALLAAVINGGIDNENIDDSAAIAGSKLEDGSIEGTKFSTSAITIGYDEILSNFTTTAVNTITDVTELSVAVTVPTGGRRVEITAYCSQIVSSQSAGNVLDMYIREGSTTRSFGRFSTPAANYGTPMTVTYSAAVSSGSHTYKVSVLQQAAGTLTFTAASDRPAFLLVKVI